MSDELEEELEEAEGRGSVVAPLASAAVGIVAMAPLFLAYEWSVRAGGPRSAAEAFLTRPLAPLGDRAESARLALVIAVLVIAAVSARARLARLELGRLRLAVARTILEGFAAAVVLGPALWYLTATLPEGSPSGGLLTGPPAQVADLSQTAAVFGAAAWEELCFRFLVYTALYLGVRRALLLARARPGVASAGADVLALLVSSLAFSAAHLDFVVAWIGQGGESFDAARFAWRALGGALLALLFRWRGLGVAAWAHGLFNAALLLGGGAGGAVLTA